MFVVLWEFDVKPGYEERFERVYGPDGDWARLFRGDANYQGTRLLREASRDGIYVTVDFWRSRDAYERFRAAASESYAALDAACKGLTAGERPIGSFEGHLPSPAS
jgi:heme-degrading monooxygenase HmoA